MTPVSGAIPGDVRGCLTVSAVAVSHGMMPALAYRIQAGAASLTFSGDVDGPSGSLAWPGTPVCWCMTWRCPNGRWRTRICTPSPPTSGAPPQPPGSARCCSPRHAGAGRWTGRRWAARASLLRRPHHLGARPAPHPGPAV